MKDLTDGGALSLTKAFLKGLAEAVGRNAWRGDGDDDDDDDDDDVAFSLYYAYRRQVTLVDDQLNFSALQRFGSASKNLIRTLQYVAGGDSCEPHHFSIFSFEEVSRLSSFLGVSVVLYLYDNHDSTLRTPRQLGTSCNDFWLDLFEGSPDLRRNFFIFHDYRLLRCHPRPSPVVAFVVASRSPRALYLLEGDSAVPSLDGFSNAWFSLRPGTAYLNSLRFVDDCYAAIDAAVAGSELVDETSGLFLGIRHLVEADRSQLYRRWAAVYTSSGAAGPVPQSFVVVVFVRMAGKNLLGLRDAKKFQFLTVAIANKSTVPCETQDLAEHVTDDAFVVCLFGNRYACRVREDLRRRVVEMHRCAKACKEILPNRSNLSGVLRNLPQAEVEAAQEAVDEKKNKKRKRPPPIAVEPICKCTDCTSSEYAKNMPLNGPDRLCSVPYSLTDLLRLLGLLSDSSEQLVDRLCQLSLAAMDIESQTISTQNRGPFPGARVCYPEVGGATFEGHVVRTQRPIMIGHTDCLTDEAGERWIDRVVDDSVSAVYDLFARYWIYVTDRRLKSTREKKKISADLFEVVATYRAAHRAFTDRWCETSRLERDVARDSEYAVLASKRGLFDADTYDALLGNLNSRYHGSDCSDWSMPDADPKMLASGFRNMLPGQLEAQLLKLCSRYVVFNFYG